MAGSKIGSEIKWYNYILDKSFLPKDALVANVESNLVEVIEGVVVNGDCRPSTTAVKIKTADPAYESKYTCIGDHRILPEGITIKRISGLLN